MFTSQVAPAKPARHARLIAKRAEPETRTGWPRALRDEERDVRPCVESILASPDPRLELVVVDDGSTDGTREILRELAGADARLRLFLQPENQGAVLTALRKWTKLCNEAGIEADFLVELMKAV